MATNSDNGEVDWSKFKPRASATPQGQDQEEVDWSKFKPRYQDVPDATLGSLARDVVAGGLQIGPTALKGVADIARLATGDRIGKGVSDSMEEGIKSIQDVVGSDRAKAQRHNFEADMRNDAVGIGETILRNKGALADQILPTVGSMFLPVGVAGAAGKAASATKAAQALSKAELAARIAKVEQAANVGTVAAQNAADTFTELLDKGASMQDAYLGAGITVPFSVVAGLLTHGGAEGAITRALSGRQAAQAGVKQFLKASGQEGAQEMGEELGQITGEAVGSGVDPTMTSVGKRLAVAGTLGAVMGGGVDAANQTGNLVRPQQPGQPQPPATPPAQAPGQQVPQQTQQQAPQQAPQQAGAGVSPNPVNAFATTEQVTGFAQTRLGELQAKRDGTPDQTIQGPDGNPLVVPGKPQEFMRPEEKAELDFLEQNIGNTQAIADAYRIGIDDQAGQPQPQPQQAAQPPAPQVTPPTQEQADAMLTRLNELEVTSQQRELDPAEQQEAANLASGLEALAQQEEAVTTPEQAAQLPEQTAQLPEQTAQLPEQAALLPEQAALLPEQQPPAEQHQQPEPVKLTWPKFLASKGVSASKIRRDTPEWVALKAEYEAAKAQKASSPVQAASEADANQSIPSQPNQPPYAQGETDGTQAPQAFQAETQGQQATSIPDAAATLPEQVIETAPAPVQANDDGIVLQNRDRSQPASVMQMQSIEREPHYPLLGASGSPETGAPMVFAEGDDNRHILPMQYGRESLAIIKNGVKVPFRYAVVSADQVQPSHFSDGSTNAAYNSKESGTIKALNNARTAGVRGAYARGTAGQYQADLMADAVHLGIDPQAVANTPNPMLVRLYSEKYNGPHMGAASQSAALGMTPRELAIQDAAMLSPAVVRAYQGGDIDSAANRDFVRGFFGTLQANGQDVASMMSGAELNQDGIRRISAALVQTAYGDSDLVQEMFESTQPEIKAIGEALKAVAGDWAKMRAAAANGSLEPEVDITGNVLKALKMVRRMRQDGMSLIDQATQTEVFSGKAPDALTVNALRMFYTGQYLTRANPRAVVEKLLREYVTIAGTVTAGPDMFGERVTPNDILATITQKGIKDAASQADPSARPESAGPRGSQEPDGGGTAGNVADEAGRGNQRPGDEARGQGAAASSAEQPGSQDGEVPASREEGAEGAGEAAGRVTAQADDFEAMFDDVLAEEVAKDDAAKPKTEKAARQKKVSTKRIYNEDGSYYDAPVPKTETEARAPRTATQSAASGITKAIENAKRLLRETRNKIETEPAQTKERKAQLKQRENDLEKEIRLLRQQAAAEMDEPARTATQSAASAAKNTAAALSSAIDGLGALFGGNGRLNSGLSFDEETYAKAKPHFQQALASLKDAGSDLKEAMRTVVRMVLDKFGEAAATNMKPYVVRFIQEMAASQSQKADPNQEKPSLNAPNGRKVIAQEIADHLIGGNRFATIVEARRFIADLTGQKVEPGTREAKLADETVELAVVMAARDIVQAARKQDRPDSVIFERLVSLYDAQPSLNVRDSESVKNQAYSTPAPLAFVASRLAGISQSDKVGEPTAGNGMLVMEVSPENATLNELSQQRGDNLASLGFENVRNLNAAGHDLAPAKSLDAVVMNPPFGAVRNEQGETITYEVMPNYTTGEIDHAIVFKALQAMKDDGKAVLIIGGTLAESDAGRRDAYRGKAKREFFYNLHQQYNVVDHFTAGGDLYKKQGTTYPVDVIVIHGRGKSERKLPAASLPPIIETWGQLKEKLNADTTSLGSEGASDDRGDRDAGGNDADGGRVPQPPELSDQGTGDGGRLGRSEAGGAQPERGGVAGSDVSGAAGSGNASDLGKLGNASPSEGSRDSGQPDSNGSRDQGKLPGTGSPGRNNPGDVGSGSRGEQNRARLSEGDAEKLQVKYSNFSGNKSVNTLVATNHLSALERAFANLQQRVGNIDEYVKTRLQYDDDGFKKAFSAEQVEALALAIDNIEQGRGFIIGDQTGIGKGRVVAAMIRYAKLNGKTPVFVTQMPDLYGDMMRDLNDIGMSGFKPLMTNNNASVPLDAEALGWFGEVQAINSRVEELTEEITRLVMEGFDGKRTKEELAAAVKVAMKASTNPEIISLRDEIAELKQSKPQKRGKFLETPDIKKHEGALKKLVEAGNIGDHDAIFTTYNQMAALDSGKPKKDKDGRKTGPSAPEFGYRNEFLQAMVNQNAMLILDESHNAGSAGDGKFPKLGDVVRGLVNKSGSVFYSSATFAKNPEVMDVYSKTDLGKAFDSPDALMQAIKTVPQQQVASAMLVEAGQYIRRERSFDGIEYKIDTVETDAQASEDVSTAMRMVVEFDAAKKAAIQEIQRALDAEGAMMASTRGGISAGSVDSTNFTSVMHNVINTFLLALKADAAADTAIAAIKAGEKPVLTVANTMEMFITDYAKEAGIGMGEAMNATFADVLMRYLERTRLARIKHGNGDEQVLRLSDAQLGPDGVYAFEQAKEFIQQMTLQIPLSPIDHIKRRIQEAGYSIGEITGRQTVVEDGVLRPRNKAELNTAGKKNTIAKFNGGGLDALVINRSGSTGLSMHASETFADQRRRVMIVAQAEPDINNHMQMLGRINRTGQVTKAPEKAAAWTAAAYGLPRYVQLTANVPIELRPAAVLSGKMAKLSANTTAGRRSAVEDSNAPDFMNKYGDEVAALVVGNDFELNRKLGFPITLDEQGAPRTENAISKVTGRIGLLPLSEQSALYERIGSEYRDLIAQLDALGKNDLEAKIYPLDAKELGKTEVIAGDSASPFTAPVIAEQVDVRKLGKPYSSEKVRELVAKSLGGMTAKKHRDGLIDSFWREMNAEIAAARLEGAAAGPAGMDAANRKQDALRAAYARFSEALPTLGEPVVIKTENGNIYGIPYAVTRKEGAKSVGALSAWRIDYAVVDGSRVMRFPMTKVFAQDGANVPESAVVVQPATTMTVVNADRSGFDSIPVMDGFDRGQTDSRETRTVLTGNLLRASAAFPGRLISFTTSDGQIRQGLMTASTFDIKAAVAKMTPTLKDPSQMVEFLNRGGEIIDRETGGDILKLRKNANGRFEVLAGKTGKGRRIAADGGLYMASSGNKMRTNLHASQAEELRDFLHRVTSTMQIQLTTSQGTKDLLGGNAPKFRRADGTSRAAALPTPTITKIADSVKAGWTQAADVVVVETMQDARVPKAARDEDAKQRAMGAAPARGFYHDGKVYLVAEGLASERDVVETMLHESLGHHGLRGVFGSDLDGILDQIITVRLAQVRAKAEAAGIDWKKEGRPALRNAAEEILADMAQNTPELGFVRRTIAAIRTWARKNVPGFRGMAVTDAEIIRAYILPARGWVQRGKQASSGAGPVAFQRVWHGTPHRGIEKFSTDKIGTGEGAQAYGWGLYFASKKEIANHYRTALSYPTLDGNRLDSALVEQVRMSGDAAAAYALGEFFVDGDFDKANARLSADVVNGYSEADEAHQWLNNNSHRLSTGGQLYEVDIPEDSEMLLWDKPLSEQPEMVRKALHDADKRAKDSLYQDGAEYYRALTSRFAQTAPLAMSVEQGENWAQRDASNYLAALGIKGIKYLDGTSRSAGDGSYNYVIFDGADTEIAGVHFSRGGNDTTGENDAALKAVEQAYGGKPAWEKDKADGKTRLTYGQWLQVRTPKFKDWFGDWENDPANASKVVDPDTGEPMVVYHGTSKDGDFSTFKVGARGVWFTRWADSASEYAEQNDSQKLVMNRITGKYEGVHTAARVMPVFLRVINPGKLTHEEAAKVNTTNYAKAQSEVFKRLGAAGYDGIQWAPPEWVVIGDATQIKSATGNNGDFSATNPSIVREKEGQADFFNKQLEQQLDLFSKSQPDASQSGAGPKLDSAKQQATDAVKGLATGESSLGRSLAREIAENQRVSLVGHQIKSAEDLASLAQVYRNPAFETMRMVFVNADRRVVAQMGVTSRLPSSSQAIMGNDMDSWMQQVNEAAREKGAVAVYLLHNHPSGDASVSRADVEVTKRMAQSLASIGGVEVRSHVVIDTNEFSVIEPTGAARKIKRDFGALAPLTHPEFGAAAIQGPADVMRLAKRMQLDDDAVTLMVLDSGNRVKAVTDVPAAAVRDNTPAANRRMLLRSTLSKQGAKIIAVARDPNLLRKLDGLVKDGIVVLPSGKAASLLESGVLFRGDAKLWPSSTDRAARFSPDTSPEFMALAPNGQPAIIGQGVQLAFAQPSERFEVIPAPGERIINFAVMPRDRFDVLGHVELLMGPNGQVKSLLDIELNARGDGYGRKVIETLLQANHGGLHISNIVQSARGFWERMGIPQQNLEEGAAYDGFIDLESYQAASNGRATGRATNPAQPGGAGSDRRADAAAKAGTPGLAGPGAGGQRVEAPNALYQAKARAQALTSRESLSNLVYQFQDKYIDLKNIRDHIEKLGGTVNDLNDAYLGEELYHARLSKRTQDFLRDEVKPLLAEMKRTGVGMAELEQYLHARHAPEANREMEKANPNQQQIDAGRLQADAAVKALEMQLQRATAAGSATKAIESALEQAKREAANWRRAQPFNGTEDERRSLSGMSDKDAADHIANLAPGKAPLLAALAARVDAINAQTLDTLQRYGLMDAATLNTWRSTYQHYVPLHRDEAHPESNSHPTGQGFNTRGDAAKRRTGSNAKVTDILAHVVMQREAALTRGEKNLVAKKVYMLAAQNPDPNVWSLVKPKLSYIDPSTGFVVRGTDPNYARQPNVLMVRIGGKDQAVVFNEHNPEAMRLAGALKNADASDLGFVASTVGKATRWFAAVNTQYNPIFGVINFIRDVGEGNINLSSTELAGQQKQVLAGIFPAMRAIYTTQRKGIKGTQGWAALWEEFQTVGGITGYRDLFLTAQDRAKDLQKELKSFDDGRAMRAFKGAVEWLNDYNETMENAVRLSAYKTGLDAGMTKERAASLAKNLTVNFNRKGARTTGIGAFYAFFNAAVQGTTRMVKTLRGPAGRKILMAGVALGAVNSMVAMAMMGAGGDDDEDHYEKIPEFIKEKNLIIPLGREDFVSVPMPLGFAWLHNVGRLSAEWAFGGKDKTLGKQVGRMMGALLHTFNPLGGDGDLGMTLAPTVIDPAVALMRNKDWTGRTIFKEDMSDTHPTPGHTRAKATASTPSRWIAEGVNTLTGGDDWAPGAVSWTPDQIDYVIGQLTGGVGRELMKVNQIATAPFTGDEIPAHKIPLAGRLYGNTRGPSAQAEPYYQNMREINLAAAGLKGRLQSDVDTTDFIERTPMVQMIEQGKAINNHVSRLRQAKMQAIRQGLPGFRDQVREIDAEITASMKRLNQDAKQVREGAR